MSGTRRPGRDYRRVMSEPAAQPLRAEMRRALTAAMKARDASAVRALRSVLAAIDNAEAADLSAAPRQESGVIAGGVAGLGAGEVARRTVTEQDVRDVLSTAIAERETAVLQYDALQRPDEAHRLRDEVAVLRSLASGRPGSA
jgi:uncharacterized protein YqeY